MADWPIVAAEDRAALQRVIDSGELWGTQHPEVTSWETEYARYVGTKYALAMNSGTAALHACVAAVGVEPGDEVLVPALTFLASATAVIHHCGIPVFIDIEPTTFNIDPTGIEAAISDRTRAIMAVDYLGLPADYDLIHPIARKHGLVVIEDGSQAGGATYDGNKVGSLGDLCGASTMPLKPIAGGGEGGILTTNSGQYRDLADMVRMFGEIISKEQEREYNAYTMGWNYRISPFSAAMARSQLLRADKYLDAIRLNAQRLSAGLAELPGITPPHVPQNRTHSYYIYYFKLAPEKAGLQISPGLFRQALQDILRAEGVYVKLSQRTPVPGQSLFQIKRGYGGGFPWSVGRKVDYRIENYPVTLDVIARSLALDARYLNPFTPKEVLEMVLEAFRKVWSCLDEVARYAQNLEYVAPWSTISRLPPKEQASEYVTEKLENAY